MRITFPPAYSSRYSIDNYQYISIDNYGFFCFPSFEARNRMKCDFCAIVCPKGYQTQSGGFLGT